jgi:SAM-dependent methyltransferase
LPRILTDTIDAAREYWNRHASRDPLWAVLSDSSKTDRRWDLPSFMQTGEREIALLFHEIRSLNLPVAAGASVDFGCGVGRLAQALARRFESVLGLDISPEMIRLARLVNKYGSRVRYETNDGPLSAHVPPDSVDFAYSNLVLQHVPPEVSSRYIADLVRSLRPGGLFVFQLPSTRAHLPRGPEPMPESAYRASVSARAVPSQMEVDSPLEIPVAIVNVSGSMWSQADVGAIRVGNHWLDAHGGMVVQDDGRATLPAVLNPDDRCRVDLQIRTPADPGKYLLELDVVHEGITWFADRGSRTCRVPIEAVPAGATPMAAERSVQPASSQPMVLPDYSDVKLNALLPAPDGAAAVSDFPMHGIASDAVAGIVSGAGGRIVRLVEDDHARPEWNGFKYFVSRQ